MDVFSSSPPSHQQRRTRSTTPPVFLRDFAYANNGPVLLPEPVRMAKGNIDETSAKTFADDIVKAKNLHKRLLSGPTVDIYVGRDRKHWSLHKNLLCHHSSYFETEFRGHEVPKRDNVPQHNKLELPDDDPIGFELLVKWLYQGRLDGEDDQMTDEKRYDYAVACQKLYQLCDKFDILHLKNLAMDGYRANLNLAQLVPDADEVNEIYRSSPPNSAFRKLMVNIAARQIMDPGMEKDAEAYRVCFDGNPDFAVEMVSAIKRMSGGGTLFDDPTAGENCGEWHDHRDGSSCYSKTKDKPPTAKGDKNPQVSNSAAKRMHRPLVELSTERATPRKLKLGPKDPGTQPNVTPARPSPKPTNLANGAISTPRRVVTDSAALRMRDRLKNLNINGENSKPEPKSATSSKASGTIPNTSTANHPSTPKRVTITPAKPSSAPSIADSGIGRASSVGSGRPRKLNQVNGIVKKFDAANGSFSGSDFGSKSDSVGRRPPPKLKRKVPG